MTFFYPHYPKTCFYFHGKHDMIKQYETYHWIQNTDLTPAASFQTAGISANRIWSFGLENIDMGRLLKYSEMGWFPYQNRKDHVFMAEIKFDLSPLMVSTWNCHPHGVLNILGVTLARLFLAARMKNIGETLERPHPHERTCSGSSALVVSPTAYNVGPPR
jgi:hypothetical protein